MNHLIDIDGDMFAEIAYLYLDDERRYAKEPLVMSFIGGDRGEQHFHIEVDMCQGWGILGNNNILHWMGTFKYWLCYNDKDMWGVHSLAGYIPWKFCLNEHP